MMVIIFFMALSLADNRYSRNYQLLSLVYRVG